MTKATVDKLSDLHGVIADELKRRIVEAEATSADLSAAIKFLKDNNITASVEDNSQMKDLKDALERRAAARAKKHLAPVATEPTDQDMDDIIERGFGT